MIAFQHLSGQILQCCKTSLVPRPIPSFSMLHARDEATAKLKRESSGAVLTLFHGLRLAVVKTEGGLILYYGGGINTILARPRQRRKVPCSSLTRAYGFDPGTYMYPPFMKSCIHP